MSKSLNSIFIPALGGTALILGLAYGLSSRQHGKTEIDVLKDRVAQSEAGAAAARDTADALTAELATLQAALDARPAASTAADTTTADPAPQATGRLGLGRQAHPDEIAAWDVDVRPGGIGLPEGKGDVWTGEEVFADNCASCHGDFAEGVDNWPVLAGGFDTLADKDPVKTVGSYWPYLSTVWDYVNRSMPFGAAQTLEPDEVYAITAYILYSNDLVDDDFELSKDNFAQFDMYNADGFIVDDRAETEYPIWSAEPCMENCKDSVEITMRASVLDVTPDEGGDDAASAMPAGSHAPQMAAATTAAPAPAETAALETTAPDPALVGQGEKVFRKCKACHQVGDGAQNRTGPVLNGVMGSPFASVDGFKYSKVFVTAASEGRVWDDTEMRAFLSKPKAHMKGTKMSFAGLKSDDDISAVIAYLQSHGG